MDSKSDDNSKSDSGKTKTVEMNGDTQLRHENEREDDKENMSEDSNIEENNEELSKNEFSKDKSAEKDNLPTDKVKEDCVKDEQNSDNQKLESNREITVIEKAVSRDTKKDANGEVKEVADKEKATEPIQRRMSLRPRSTPKKYVDVEESSDDESKDPLAVKDPLAIPLGKNSSTVLIRKSPATVSVKTTKSPVKINKVTRPPPELIKAPLSTKISVSPATTVTVVPRSKENTSNSGFVIVDTQSILTGKGPVAVSTVPASVTVSAIPSVSKNLPKSASAPILAAHKKATAPPAASPSVPDPFESLGLADDSFIVEAPSFVVPYLIEKAAPKSLKKCIEALVEPIKPAEDVIVLSEDDSTDSDKKDSESEKSSMDKSSMKSEMEKSSMKTEMEKSMTKLSEPKDDDDYFSGAIGRFFLDIGLSLVQEYVQGDLLRVQKRKLNKGTKISDPSLTVPALTKGLEVTRAKNEPYRISLRQCDRCSFRSESSLILAHHWCAPYPVGSGPNARYACHWCNFDAREPHIVSAHMESDHQIKSRNYYERPLHQCPLCPFEDNIKSKVTRHIMSCQKRFISERNLEPPIDWEPPAKIPRIPARGIRSFAGGINPSNIGYPLPTKGAVPFALPAYHPLLPKSALLNTTLGYSVLPTTAGKGGKPPISAQTALAGFRLPAELHVVQGSAQRSGTPPQGKTQIRQTSGQSSLYLSPTYAVPSNQIYQLLHGQSSVMSVLPTGSSKTVSSGSSASVTKKPTSTNPITLVPGLVSASGLTIQSSTAPVANKVRPNQQPSISITPLPRSSTTTPTTKPSLSVSPVTTSTGNTPLTAKAGQPPAPGQKGTTVMCEICDGSIKDLEQLRHHMQWIHKVKIHPKMIHNRPPLNCQKCQCRFFTDQGLERHLLGSHGLVTSSMQEAANRGQDGGRCPICGKVSGDKVHQWKLLSHVVKDHGLSLKPAHLSYKCTVCTATFTMYKLFENHVYTAHSVVARKVLDKDRDKDKKVASSSSSTPLRINDEITIIPQPARSDSEHVCRGCGSIYDVADAKRQLKRLEGTSGTIQGSDQKCASCLRLASSKGEKRNRVDVIDLSDDEDKEGVTLPKSQVTITKVPAPKGYSSKPSKEPPSKRSRSEDIDTE